MELLEGIELLEFLNSMGDQGDPFIRYMFKEILIAINELHKAGLSHRDIKLDNLMISRDGKIKIIDLGFAKMLAGTDGTGFMRTHRGTPMYMSPEIETRQTYQGADADLFAYAVSLMVFRIKDYPWTRARRTDPKYKLLGCNGGVNAAQFWASYENDIDPDFKTLMQTMLAEDPTSRIPLVDVLGSEWMRKAVQTEQEFLATVRPIVDAEM